MNKINSNLVEYIKNNVFPVYKKNESGHGINHIKYVIRRSLDFANQFSNINLDMVYTIAAYHDIAHHIDAKKHEILSAEYFFNDENMKDFFNESERIIIKEAIEDHRASSGIVPRSDYGKIVSSADRYTDVKEVFTSTHSYYLKHTEEKELYLLINLSYNHVNSKYGNQGYSHNYCIDKEHDQFLKDVKTLLSDKWLYAQKYMEVNNINDIKAKAKVFAILAHHGQVRKSEPEKPMIIHPIAVAKLLEEYGYDDNVVASGYLHDVVEDTKYTLDDIKSIFGEDIADLVNVASEPDKSLSWEERRKHTIEKTKNLPLRKKLVIAADKINNLEDLAITFAKTGKRDFSRFNRGEEQQRWYYSSIYESLIYNEDESAPIFQRLKNVLDIVYNGKEDLYLKDTIFVNKMNYYNKLKKLHAQKLEIKRLNDICKLKKPFVIEFSGTPRTGKTSTIHNLYDFFKKGGFKSTIIEEFTTSKYYKDIFKETYKDASLIEKNLYIIEKITEQLREAINSDVDIILVDRSINDRQMWNYRLFSKGQMPKELYEETKEKYKNISKELIDYLIITYANPIVSQKRDYYNSLALEKRTHLYTEYIEEYNKSLAELKTFFESSVQCTFLLDTTKKSMNDVAIVVANKILKTMRKQYIQNFKDVYEL